MACVIKQLKMKTTFHLSFTILLRSLNTENIKYLNISRAEAGTGQREQQELENRFATLFLNSV
jgi:hypothetical protein